MWFEQEHAPWALQDYGFRVVIAPSFADIFFSNCFKIGLLPIVLGTDSIDRIFSEVDSTEGYALTVNLEDQTVTTPVARSAVSIPIHSVGIAY